MPVFAVTKPIGTTNAEFEIYVELLRERGVDILNQPRVPEPGTQNRWLHVWQETDAAESFAAELRARTSDISWFVHEFNPEALCSTAFEAVEIIVMHEVDGYKFCLSPTSTLAIRSVFPGVNPVDNVFVGYDTLQDWQGQHGVQELYNQICIVMTGLHPSRLADIGGVRIFDHSLNQILFEQTSATPSPA